MPQAENRSTPSAFQFHNLTAGEIVDQLGHLKAEIADLKTREDVLRGELIARGTKEAEGYVFRATVSEALRETLDAGRIRVEMGAAWCSERSKIAVVTTVRISARTGAVKHAA